MDIWTKMNTKLDKFVMFLFVAAAVLICLYTVKIVVAPQLCRFDTAVVSSKTFVPEHNQTYTSLILIGKVLVPIVNTVHYDDEWVLGLDYDNDFCDRDVSVPVDVYNEYSIGQEYIDPAR